MVENDEMAPVGYVHRRRVVRDVDAWGCDANDAAMRWGRVAERRGGGRLASMRDAARMTGGGRKAAAPCHHGRHAATLIHAVAYHIHIARGQCVWSYWVSNTHVRACRC